MGFGLLLIGYVFAYVATIGLGPYMFAGMLVGGFFMYLGLCELKKYSPVFLYALIGSILIIVCSVYEAAAWVDSTFMLGIGLNLPTVSAIFKWIKTAIYAAFELLMLYGIYDLSKRVDYSEIGGRSLRNMIIVVLFNAFQIFTRLPFIQSLENEDFKTVMTILMIFQLVYTVVNAFLIFKCYGMICPAGQENMQRKPSRFAFVNKIREIRDANEEKAIEDMKNYYEDKLKKKNSKKTTKKHKKK